MRAFRASLVIFALMLALIVVGTVYGRWVCREMAALVEALPDTPSVETVGQAEALSRYWQAQTPYLRPLVNRTVVRTVSDLVSELSVCADPALDAATEYRTARRKLLSAIDEMRRTEKATFGLWS
ncbi:MAG: hypothetical protein J6R04_05535 [Clostridia bacterium]|nr:hypothetical protein [Clostridia bacterium]